MDQIETVEELLSPKHRIIEDLSRHRRNMIPINNIHPSERVDGATGVRLDKNILWKDVLEDPYLSIYDVNTKEILLRNDKPLYIGKDKKHTKPLKNIECAFSKIGLGIFGEEGKELLRITPEIQSNIAISNDTYYHLMCSTALSELSRDFPNTISPPRHTPISFLRKEYHWLDRSDILERLLPDLTSRIAEIVDAYPNRMLSFSLDGQYLIIDILCDFRIYEWTVARDEKKEKEDSDGD